MYDFDGKQRLLPQPQTILRCGGEGGRGLHVQPSLGRGEDQASRLSASNITCGETESVDMSETWDLLCLPLDIYFHP